ncbi:uncharacterized protein LOC5568338 [Aedes aegypti]|uniref:EGF-like domain-containing protein n=1 Tax=Aedes aegypti TaxID=7159 RepID=A0A1S4EXN9_AEDAE|nr:uncharacterized protein LOC5568338 [Aedes aegypti]XP_021710740.1 uncharacterized protein LOC5568338 [Aedes aegypti]XP_021710747.1 uncharacterized protein LOC5568338 [Aedes aegypti]
MFAIRIKSIPAMCSRVSTSISSSSNVLIVGALFLIIVEINQTDCNFILPNVGTASGGLLNNDDVSISTSSSSEKIASSYDETTSSYSTAAGGSTGSTSSPSSISNNASSATASSPNQNASTLNGFEGQIPLERLPSNTLLKYTAYKDVSILHFRIPTDTRTAFFSFKAYEESKSAFQRVCQPNDITLHLKAGSYPVISPENITFPKHFLSADERFEIHNLQFKSDSITRRLSIDGPHPGNWFAVAFISWTDPNNERIEQQGLAPSCETLLMSEMAVARITPVILNARTSHRDTLSVNQTEPKSYKFFVPSDISMVTWRLQIKRPCNDCSDVSFAVQAHALPTHKDYLQNAIICPNQTGDISIDFYPQESAWHYVDVDFLNESDGGHSNRSTAETKDLELEYVIEMEFESSIVESSEEEHKESAEESGQQTAEKVLQRRGFEHYALLRQTYREFFMFDYDLLPDINGTVPLTLNLSAGTPALMKFDVNDVYDIGGTLSFAVAMRQDMKSILIDAHQANSNDHVGVVAEKLIDIQENFVEETTTTTSTTAAPTNAAQETNRSNQTVIVCMRIGEPGIPTWPDKCIYGRHIFPAAITINNTDSDTSTGLVHIPFPEPGKWYVTLGIFCHGAETAARITVIDSVKEFIKKYREILLDMKQPCSCAEFANYYRECLGNDSCLAKMNETETLKIKECIMDAKCTDVSDEMAKKFEVHHKFATEQSVAADASCNGSVVFTISSSPCVAGRCGRFGRCYHYMSGGFVFSTCLCLRNYRGWDCTEDSQVPSSTSILLASLMLTLSNLLFLPSIFFAVKRGYYTESIIYFFAMFFSTFYHACDSGEEEFSFCLVKIGVLQFCDFYCGLLAIWVTLIAMSNIRHQFVSLLHMLGAILLAFGTELNKQSLWVFLAPALTGICLISVSWGLRCRKTKKCFPSRGYLAVYLPIGSVLVMVGLVCYAFLQTKQNYHIVHSIWHMVMALSILCLLPSRKTFQPKC